MVRLLSFPFSSPHNFYNRKKFNKSHIKRGSWITDKTDSFLLLSYTQTDKHTDKASGKGENDFEYFFPSSDKQKFSGNKREIKTIEICFAKTTRKKKEVESNKFIIGRLVGMVKRWVSPGVLCLGFVEVLRVKKEIFGD